MGPKIMILLGSASDYKIADKAIDTLEKLKLPYDIRVASAHRTHEKVKKIVSESTLNDTDVFIGIAGLSAHLPGIIAANTHKPVIGVPVDVKVGGLDALFATVQMPFGAPVATVGVDRGENAAILAAQAIGINDTVVRKRLANMRRDFFQRIREDEISLLEKIKQGKYYSPQNYETETETKDKSDSKDSPRVAVISGSYSDMKVAKKTTMFLETLKISYDSTVISPVRSPQKFENFLEKNDNTDIFIAIAGLSAHVTGAVVAYTEKPVLGVPCARALGGFDALLSMVNMPPGVPVATIGINEGGNAAILAAEMLSIGDESVKAELTRFLDNISRKR
jgi:5-(carboxyamino)imidazole ribonucleotide mutase